MHCLFDWLTVSFKTDLFDSLESLTMELLGISLDNFTDCRGRYGYSKGKFFDNITLLSDGFDERMGVCFEISGKGCQGLYNSQWFIENDGFDGLFKRINSIGGSITRLDIALDLFDNELDYTLINDAILSKNYSSRWHNVTIMTSVGRNCSDFGYNFQFGSRRSNVMLRIYDKKVEQRRDDIDYWCRFEFQCRNDMAHSFADTYLNKEEDFVVFYIMILNHYLRFIERKYGKSNSDKCPTLPWWEKFLGDVTKSLSFTT